MLILRTLLAIGILHASPDVMDTPEAYSLHGYLAPAVSDMAMQWELLDKRELDFMFVSPSEFGSDVRQLQERRRELANAPLLSECNRFPDRATVADLMAYNRSYREGLIVRLAVDKIHAEEIQTALQETDLLYRIWDLVRDTRSEYFYVIYRRQSLQQLRELVGDHDFLTGQLPPCIPLWRLPIVD